MCKAIGLAERTYYAARARPPCPRRLADEVLKVEIRRVFEANWSCYGARRVWLALRREDIAVARCTVERLMADMAIRGVQRGKKRYTTRSDATATRPPDLVERRFVADRPDELWLADITYASTWEGWLYVSFILDCYSRMIVGWQIATHLRTDLILDALEMAIFRRDVTAGLVHHSELGRVRARCRHSGRSVSLTRPPNRTCDFHRIRLSVASCRRTMRRPLRSLSPMERVSPLPGSGSG
jgi:transposase InsO family protein